MRFRTIPTLVLMAVGAALVLIASNVRPTEKGSLAFGNDDRKAAVSVQDLLDEIPRDARPYALDKWEPRAWNKFVLWLETLKARDVVVSVRATSIRPWQHTDGKREVVITCDPVHVRLAGRWTTLGIAGAYDGMVFAPTGVIAFLVESEAELDRWFAVTGPVDVDVTGKLVWLRMGKQHPNALSLNVTQVRQSR